MMTGAIFLWAGGMVAAFSPGIFVKEEGEEGDRKRARMRKIGLVLLLGSAVLLLNPFGQSA